MLNEDQYKAIELLVTGHTVSEAAREAGVTNQTVYTWMRTNSEFMEELSRATDSFSKECVKSRSRAYRVLNKKILDKIMEKIDDNSLEEVPLADLVDLLKKSVGVMRNDEDVKKMPHTAIQNNIQINNETRNKLQQEDFARQFSKLLCDNMSSDELEEIVQAKEKVDREIEIQRK